MFISLLVVMFAVALATAAVVARLFDRPVGAILTRLIADEIGVAWLRYIKFALYVVGVSWGVRVWTLEQLIAPEVRGQPRIVLDGNRWVLEVYRTVLGALQATAWVLLLFFLVALVAYVIVRGQELRHGRSEPPAAAA